MLKKILLIIILLFTFFTQLTFAGDTIPEQTQKQKDAIQTAGDAYEASKKEAQDIANKTIKNNQGTIDDAKKRAEEAKEIADSVSAEGYYNEELYAKADKLKKEADELQSTLDDIVKEELSESNDERDVYNQSLIDNGTLKQKKQGTQGQADILHELAKEAKEYAEANPSDTDAQTAATDAQTAATDAQTAATEAADKYSEFDESKDDIADIGFKINVNDITPGKKVVKGDTVAMSVNRTLGTVIQSMMIFLGSVALFVMSVGAGYMILHHGQDELLSKGKAIFMSGVYALVVALGSYYLVAIFRFILFKGN